MDPRKSRFSPYEVRGGPGGGPGGGGAGRQGFRNNQPPSPQRDDVFYGRGEPRRNIGMSGNNGGGNGGGGGGPMMRAKGSRFQRASEYDNNEFMNAPSIDRASISSASSYHTAAPSRRVGGQSRWEPATARRDNNWDDDRVSLSNEETGRGRSGERLPAHIEQRVAREKPCRTLFVRNIQYDLKAHEIREMYEKFGEVKEVFNLIESRGMVFVTFYDIRAAEKAKDATQGMFLANRRIDVHYSLPKEEEENAKCDRTKNQGTLLFTLKNTDSWLQDDQLYDYFGQYGEVKIIRTPHFRHHSENNERRHRQRFVEFYDSRGCVDAYDGCHGEEYKGGRWDVSFFWDHTNRERSEAFAAKKERPTEMRIRDRRDNTERRRGGGRGGDFSRSRRHFDEDRRGSYEDYGRGGSRYDRRSASPRDENRRYNPEIPTYTQNEDHQRLEQAQKAQQQLLTMFAQNQDEPDNGLGPSHVGPHSQYPPVQTQHHQYPPHLPQAGVAQAPPQPQQPVAADQTAQLQQVLGLLTHMAAQQQQQQQQQQQYQVPPQPVPVAPPAVSQPPASEQQQPSAPITDPAAALSQLAQILQTQQQQQQPPPQQQQQQSPYPPVSSAGGWKRPDQPPQ
ncbi:hypothetical protein BDA99DRAFT_563490 [Phascolomyces articulosus]|uniref:RRM domain-containing protein n=1 Tax=Phascolomyces articulosus TaxID=60185 RepID=A0AAD5K2B1_9FUNG|nr:hypothetical protein BDA99DRAFT_563490 [Phascolomyces articulosus]